tara:strand:- start:3007 stop:4329 length:1323 start_codon:yes stop_codon:yes gene_type:complete
MAEFFVSEDPRGSERGGLSSQKSLRLDVYTTTLLVVIHKPPSNQSLIEMCPGCSRVKFQGIVFAVIFCCSSPVAVAETISSFFVDLGADVTVRGVTRLPDGTAMVVGYTGDFEQAKFFEIAPNGAEFTSVELAGLGGRSVATAVSANGEYIVGYSQSPGSADVGEGTVWTRSTNWSAMGVGLDGLLFPSSVVSDVASNGVAAGDEDGARGAFSWSPTNGRTSLESRFGNGGAIAVSDDGRLFAGLGSLTFGVASPLLWAGSGMEVLAHPDLAAVVRDMSDNGVYISGFSETFDPFIFQTFTNAALWVDSDRRVTENQSAADYEFMYLLDMDGDPFQGEVTTVSDNGYAFGGSPEGAFIWHESFDGVRLLDEWLITEHGISLPTNPTNVTDVFFDGQNLNLAVEGSGYFISTNVAAIPEPSVAVLLIACTALISFRRLAMV